ncbi:MAG: nucleoside-diphosphate sugar epimerase [Flavobacteriaceae bacterium]|nr:nucleoside-diphosphate sugar epimerase [Flavobacteriaceae bacterium]
MELIDISDFINKKITFREKSMFQNDVDQNKKNLSKNILNKSVLVIGGAGTIGSSFIKEILNFKPSKLVVVDTNENGLTELTRDLRSSDKQFIPKVFLTYPLNFSDRLFKKMFNEMGPFNIVANFAAHKHVRSEKDKFSIEAMIVNNVFNAKELLDHLVKNKPEHFFCVSTDKAANPVNIMGASKKLMEEMILSYGDKIKISTARFANVAFSNGSLLAGYIERFFKKQPLSCPSDVKRFFVSPKESGQICMLACLLGESKDIFFPKLYQKDLMSFKKITEDLFNYMNMDIIECSSEEEAKKFKIDYSKNLPYPVYFFKSDTSGEKLYEEFYVKDDFLILNKFKSLGIIKNSSYDSLKKLNKKNKQLIDIFKSKKYNKKNIVSELKKVLSNFNHVETGKSLDEKM